MSTDLTIVTVFSSLSALTLSIYNWYKARQGAILKLSEGYRYGIFTYQSGRKLLYLPLDVMNVGNRVGKINLISYELISPDGIVTKFYPSRRVETRITGNSSPDKLTQKDLREMLPTLPVFCPPGEGISILYEYYEDVSDDQILKKDVMYTGKVAIIYNTNKTDELDFKLQISEDAWNRSGSTIFWISFS